MCEANVKCDCHQIHTQNLHDPFALLEQGPTVHSLPRAEPPPPAPLLSMLEHFKLADSRSVSLGHLPLLSEPEKKTCPTNCLFVYSPDCTLQYTTVLRPLTHTNPFPLHGQPNTTHSCCQSMSSLSNSSLPFFLFLPSRPQYNEKLFTTIVINTSVRHISDANVIENTILNEPLLELHGKQFSRLVYGYIPCPS